MRVCYAEGTSEGGEARDVAAGISRHPSIQGTRHIHALYQTGTQVTFVTHNINDKKNRLQMLMQLFRVIFDDYSGKLNMEALLKILKVNLVSRQPSSAKHIPVFMHNQVPHDYEVLFQCFMSVHDAGLRIDTHLGHQVIHAVGSDHATCRRSSMKL